MISKRCIDILGTRVLALVSILMLLTHNCKAQRDNIWVLHSQDMLIMDFNHNPVKLRVKKNFYDPSIHKSALASCNTFAFNSKLGNLEYFTFADGSIYDSNYNHIYKKEIFRKRTWENIILTNQESLECLNIVDIWRPIIHDEYLDSCFFTSFENNIFHTRSFSIETINQKLTSYYQYDVTYQDDNINYLALAGSGNIKIFRLEPKELPVKLDSAFINFSGYLGYQQFAYSHDGMKLAIGHGPLDGSIFGTFILSQIHFNPITHKIDSIVEIDRDEKKYGSDNHKVIHSTAYSSDNRFLFVLSDLQNGRDWELARYDLATGQKEVTMTHSKVIHSNLRIGPDGKMYIIPAMLGGDKFDSHIGVIKRPNSNDWVSSVSFSEKHLNVANLIDDGRGLFLRPRTNGRYLRVDFADSNACTGKYTHFKNLSDSTAFVCYRFYFGDGDSAEIDNQNKVLNAGENTISGGGFWGVKHEYKSAGTYTVKLRAFNRNGGWVWYDAEVKVKESSQAKFSVADTMGCQWVAHTFTDKSKVINKGKDISYYWDFGDGTDSVILNPRTNTKQEKRYKTSGQYLVSLAIDDGYCQDTFSLVSMINILPAPQPGLKVTPLSGCEPLRVVAHYKYQDLADSIRYTWDENNHALVLCGPDCKDAEYIYRLPDGVNQTTAYTIYQHLHAPTGCVTVDSSVVRVFPSMDVAKPPKLKYVSVKPAGQVEVHWEPLEKTEVYSIYRNDIFIDSTRDLNYVDSTALSSLESYSYKLESVNRCEAAGVKSNEGKTILLKGILTNHNAISVIEWTSYLQWEGEVAMYQIEVFDDGIYKTIGSLDSSGQLYYEDKAFLSDADGLAASKCYRVTALSAADQLIKSHSNTLCMEYEPVLFVPNAVSPNNDGLNDVFQPTLLGVVKFQFQVYSRWGEKIYDGSDFWDPQLVPPGVYQYTIQVLDNNGERHFVNGVVHVVK